jgi:hypothetical protein|tara:strand:+ start:205 stop:834 length:630 start_codon:yes stop_codon:yes gene_type:complete
MIKKDSFIVYRSFYIGLKALTNKDRLHLYDAIFEYGLNSNEIDLKPLPKAMFLMIKPQLQANHRKFINGTQGGRPVDPNSQRQQNKQSEAEPNHNQDITKTEPNVNVNVNDNNNHECKVALPLKDGTYIKLDNVYMEELSKTYPKININVELQKMRTWLISNPIKQKTNRGTPRFIANWLSKIKHSDDKPTDSYASIHKAVMDSKNVRR